MKLNEILDEINKDHKKTHEVPKVKEHTEIPIKYQELIVEGVVKQIKEDESNGK